MATTAYVVRIRNRVELRLSHNSIYALAASSVFPEADELYEDRVARCLAQYEASAAVINREIKSCQGYNK